MSTNLRLVRHDELAPAETARRTSSTAPALRPTRFDDYIGQADLVANPRESVRAAKLGGWQLDHYLMVGAPGLGKTSLALVIANELGTKLRATSAPAIEHKGALASLLTTLADGDVLFIDEIHALDRTVAEILYSAMEDCVLDLPAGRRVIRVALPKITLLGATTNASKLPKPLLDRFGFVWQLQPYTLPEMQTIVTRAAGKLGLAIDDAGALVIARASRGTPRIANRLLRRVRDTAVNAAADGRLASGTANGAINGSLAVAVLAQLGLDQLGLDQLERRYLAIVAAGRCVGIEAIAGTLSEQRRTIEEIVEPFLVQLGLVARTAKGRILTEAGFDHVKILNGI